MHSTGTIPTEADHDADIDTINALRTSQEATNQYQRSNGFAQYQQGVQAPTGRRAIEEQPLEPALQRLIICRVVGVLHDCFGRAVEVQMPPGNWRAAKQHDRNAVLAAAVAKELAGKVHNSDGKIADTPEAVEAKLERALRTEFVKTDTGALRNESSNSARNMWCVRTPPRPKVVQDNSYCRKQQKRREKQARELRRARVAA